MLKFAAEYIIKRYNGCKCPNCRKEIELDFNRVYNKLKRNKSFYSNKIYCKKCDDKRYVIGKSKYIYIKNGKKYSKEFVKKTDAFKWFNDKLYCVKCNDELLKVKSIFNNLKKYYNKGTYDFTNCKCRYCTNVSITTNKNMINKRNENPNFILHCVENGKNIHTQNKRALTQALNRYSKLDKIYLYYAEIFQDSGVYKIGITKNINERSHYFSSNYKSITRLLESDPITICNLEYRIKEKFQLLNYKFGTEFFIKDDLQKIKNFVNNHKKDYI